jgi:hypothetical protein
MIIAKSSVMAFAKTMGMLFVNSPNRNHNNVPKAKSEYIDNEMPEVFFV